VILTRPYEYHHCIYHSNEPHEHFWLTFSPVEEFEDLFGRGEEGMDRLFLLKECGVEEMCAALEELMREGSDLLKRRLSFLRIFSILRESIRGRSAEVTEALPRDVTEALGYMDLHLTEAMEIREVAIVCGVSVNTLERHFKETLGVSPFAMLRKKRLIMSMEYLREGESVTEAALKSGFSDYSNYIQLFRRQFGLTPLQYKKTVEKG
jgi:AraC-like DNA-binding protein